MRFLIAVLFFCADVFGYDADFFIDRENYTEATLHDITEAKPYTVSLRESQITSQQNIFYLPLTIKDEQANVLRNVDFQIDNEQLTVNLTEQSGNTVILVPISLHHIRNYYSSGTSVSIPMVMTVHVDENTQHVVRFCVIVHTIGRLSVSPDRIQWVFRGNWSECSDTINLNYAGVLYNMNVSIVSDNNFCMTSRNSNDRISYSISNSRLRGNKNSGYTANISDNETLDIQVSVDPDNSLFVKAGDYSDSITLQLVPAV